MQKFASILLLATLLLTQSMGCAVTVPYGLYEDKRLMDTITDDKAISTSIKASLLDAKFTDGWATSVFCYYGKVFLVGEVPANMQEKAVEIARKEKGVRSVTTHWFKALESKENDFFLATKLRTNLISADGVSATRIDTVVNSGRVVLLGVVNSAVEKDKVIQTAKDTSGVSSVIDYLMLPQ